MASKSVGGKQTLVDLFELGMVDFDIILAVHDSGLDQLVLIEIPRNWISNSPYYFLADSTYIHQ